MKKISLTTVVLTLLFLIAGYLRFFKLEGFTTFLADQGRDAIIIKRMISFEHFPAIGPPSSIGGVLLGPFYYYLIAPFLALFQLDPVGMAYGVAFLTMIGIATSVYFVKKELGGAIALMFMTLVTFSSVNISFARFAWNPNLLFVSGFINLYFFYKFLISKNKLLYGALTGLLFSLNMQLHHLAFFLLPPMMIYFFIYKREHKKSEKNLPHWKNWVAIAAAFLVGYSPLILFDLKHGFINTKSLLNLFLGGEFVAKSSPFYLFHQFAETIEGFITHVFMYQFNRISTPKELFTAFALSVVFILFLSGVYFYLKKSRRLPGFVELNFLMVIIYLILFSFLNTNHIPHYYASIYYPFFLIIAYVLSLLPLKKNYSLLIIGVFVIGYIYTQSTGYYFFKSEPNNQINEARTTAQSILDRHPQQPYQIAGLPFTETEQHIRYFLELYGPRPEPADTNNPVKQLYIICHTTCQPLADPQWQIAAFTNGKINDTWKINSVTIYQAVHK